MKFFFYIFIVLMIPADIFSQSAFRQFQKLSRPEKHWVLSHPFKAKKAMDITKDVLMAVDSIKQAGVIGTDINGGKLDAFKHAYWMGSLSIGIGSRKSLKLGKAHEKGNKLQFKKHELEESILPDSVSSAMDLHNNSEGVNAVKGFKKISKQETQKKIMNVLQEGKLVVIKKDKQGNYLQCDGTIINMSEWLGKWNIPKCLINSN